MKRYIFLLIALLPLLTKGQAVFDNNTSYIITCFDTKLGGIVANENITTDIPYPLVYDEAATIDDSNALWIIKEEYEGLYSIKNVATNKYIEYAPNKEAEKYINMLSVKTVLSTLFVIKNEAASDNITYWSIRPASDESRVFDKRKYAAVGPYGYTGGSNQLFSFKSKEGKYVSEPAPELPVYGLENYFESFTLEGKTMVYDNRDKRYFYSIPLEQMDTDVTLNLGFVSLDEKNYKVKINGVEIANEQDVVFPQVKANKAFKIQVIEGSQVLYSADIIFTGLPIVQVYSDGNTFSENYSKGRFRVNEGTKTYTQTGELVNAEIRYRGATARGYDKKAFAIKLRNDNWESLDRSFFGLRNDKYWILDAMAMDRSRMRNRVTTDLWNDFSADPYHKVKEPDMVNGTRGKYVEVFIDDEYWGLYCMTERIDRKQLKLKKYQPETETIRGVLYKATGWSYEVLMGSPYGTGKNAKKAGDPLTDFDDDVDNWVKYEAKYPDFEDGEPITWQPLYDVVDLAALANNYNFNRKISDAIDIPVWRDYYLLMELILASDNHGKNAYYYMHNITEEQKLGIAVWDLDGVFGIRWDKNRLDPTWDYISFIKQHEWEENNLYKRLKANNTNGFRDNLIKRYNYLRFNYFTADNLIQRFVDYVDMFEKTGAATREIERWSGANSVTLDFEEELTFLEEWIYDRVDYLNQQYGPAEPPIPDGVEDVKTVKFAVYPNPVEKILFVENVIPNTQVWIYSDTGVCLYQNVANTNSLSIDLSSYSKGRYFVKVGNEGKVIIKK
ncbi:hypothetical protein M2138_001405 [Dysgonomonadaceae bacterium PH5-43]|nr:hypothetical protein [Dysgonomonadaceae bacterium PH5-43]